MGQDGGRASNDLGTPATEHPVRRTSIDRWQVSRLAEWADALDDSLPDAWSVACNLSGHGRGGGCASGIELSAFNPIAFPVRLS